MHLSDNQGWRIEIKKYPELAEIGGQLPNNGRKGGYYTQEEFKDLVNYANERFITIIPEVDIPGAYSCRIRRLSRLQERCQIQDQG